MYSSPETGEEEHSIHLWIDSPLHAAIFKDEKDSLEAVLKTKEPIDKLHEGMTPLYLCCLLGNEKIAKVLINQGCNINLGIPGEGSTPLHNAACGGSVRMLKLLLQSRANINSKNKTGNTPLWLAVQHNHLEVVRILMDNRAEVNIPTQTGITPLSVAALNGFHQATLMLINGGANVDPRDFNGNTPLMHAVRNGGKRVTQILVDAGANVNLSNNAGEHPINLAALHGNVGIIKALHRAGCDVNAPSFAGHPISIAVQREHVAAVRQLIECGANLDVREDINYTPTPLIQVIQNRTPNLHIVNLLIRGGCDVNLPSPVFLYSPLEYAIMNGHTEIVHLLLDGDCEAKICHLSTQIGSQNARLVKVVMKGAKLPISLKRSCRICIRKAIDFGVNYEWKVSQLALPGVLRDYLTYRHVSYC